MASFETQQNSLLLSNAVLQSNFWRLFSLPQQQANTDHLCIYLKGKRISTRSFQWLARSQHVCKCENQSGRAPEVATGKGMRLPRVCVFHSGLCGKEMHGKKVCMYLTARGIGAFCRVHYRPRSCSFWSLRPPLCGWRGCVCCLWTRSRFARWCPGAVYSCTTSPVSDIKRKSIIISAGKGGSIIKPHQVYYENFYLASQAGCVLHMPFTHSLDPTLGKKGLFSCVI